MGDPAGGNAERAGGYQEWHHWEELCYTGVTGNLLGQLGMTGNYYKHAESNWGILGVSVTKLR